MIVFLLVETDFHQIIELYHQITQWMVFLSFTGYGLYSFYVFRQHTYEQVLKQKILITRVIGGSFLFISGVILVGFISFVFGIQLSFNMRYIYFALMLGMFFSVLHIRMRLLLTKVDQKFPQLPLDITPQLKYRKLKVSEEEFEDVMDKINTLFSLKKPYLDQEYSLDQLAQDTGLPKLKITQALNIHQGQNFYQFINSARIEESKLLLNNNTVDNLTVVGYESGFKSKSTFYKYFKEATGASPSDYKKSLMMHGAN